MEVGIIKSLWRYPVKSLAGEPLENLKFNERGAVDDRIYAISTRDGKLGSGKDTRRFRRIDKLFSLSATKTMDGVSISFPDGLTLTDKDESIDVKLSEVLGQEVKLARESEVSHLDDGAVHILISSALTDLQEELSHSEIDERRFRPNIIIDTFHSDDDLVGNILKVGNVILNVTHKTERCRMITLEQPGIANRPEILKTVSKRHDLLFGTYASVLSSGTISLGDKVELLHKQI